jgi:copper chaperone
MCATDDDNATVSESREYVVKGMTCDHCVMSVSEEVGQVSGVTGVDVELDTGRVVVRGEGFTDDAIRDAVDEAGYEVVAP